MAAKRRLFRNQTAEDYAILNVDDPVVAGCKPFIPAQQLAVSLSGSADGRSSAGRVENGLLVVETEPTGRLEVCRVDELPMPGDHNRRNFLCAALAALLAGASVEAMREAIRAFQPAPHLLIPVGTVRGVAFRDDSKATNPASAIADLKALSGEVIVVAGGKDKGADFAEFGDVIAEHAACAFLIGETRAKIGDVIAGRVPTRAC